MINVRILITTLVIIVNIPCLLLAYDGYSWKKPLLTDYISSSADDGYFPGIDVNAGGDAILSWSQKVNNDVKLVVAIRSSGTWDKTLSSATPIPSQYILSPSTTFASFANYAQVAIARNGDAAAVWRQNTTTLDNSYAVFYAERRSGNWIKPLNITGFFSLPNSKADSPEVAMNDLGDTAIVWQQMDISNLPAHIRIYAAVYKAPYSTYENNEIKTVPGQWIYRPATFEDHISTGTGDATNPQIVIDNAGNVTTTWNQDNANGTSQIYVSRFEAYLQQWTSPQPVSDGATAASRPHLAVSKRTGLPVVTWTQNFDANSTMVYYSYPSPSYSNDWLLPPLDHYISVAGYTACMAGMYDAPDVALNDYNNLLFAWDQANTNFPLNQETQIFMAEQRYGVWTSPMQYSDHISMMSGDKSFEPVVAINNRGYSVIAWLQRNGPQYSVFMSEFTDISGTWQWQNPQAQGDALNQSGGTSAGLDLALSQRGYGAITWGQHDGTHYRIYLAERLP